LQNGGIVGPHISFTWYRGSPIGPERKTEELSRTSVEDINIDGQKGFIAVANDPTLGDATCEIVIQTSSDDFFEWSISFAKKPFPDACGIAKELSHQSIAASTAAPSAPGATDAPRPAQQYPNLLKGCDTLDGDIAKTVGADPLDIQSTFVGAVCRWQAANPAGLIDITRYWFELGSLDNETAIAGGLHYQIENRSIAGVKAIVMRVNEPNGACGVASDAGGVVGWWVNPQMAGFDACAAAIKLMEMTLATNP
jgi:hypothetical protein